MPGPLLLVRMCLSPAGCYACCGLCQGWIMISSMFWVALSLGWGISWAGRIPAPAFASWSSRWDSENSKVRACLPAWGLVVSRALSFQQLGPVARLAGWWYCASARLG